MKILSVFLIGAIPSARMGAIAFRVACGIAFTSPVLANDYQPPNNGTIGTGTKESDCTYRGSDRREDCI